MKKSHSLKIMQVKNTGFFLFTGTGSLLMVQAGE